MDDISVNYEGVIENGTVVKFDDLPDMDRVFLLCKNSEITYKEAVDYFGFDPKDNISEEAISKSRIRVFGE
jgi:hypothetical protein